MASACGGVLWYQANHLFKDIHISTEQLSDAEVALKGSMGEAIFDGNGAGRTIPGTGLEAVLQPTPSPNREALIEEYKKNPELFHRYARMFDTALNAMQVGKAVLRLPTASLPLDSSHLKMESASAVDAWGDPFCIVRLRGGVAIVSGGPSKLSCAGLPLTRYQITHSSRSVFAGPDDVIVVIVSHP